ncbi:hypothetical protein D3C76_918480 [compost metagenome]
MVVVIPHVTVPSSGSNSPISILNNVVSGKPSFATNAILSPFVTVKETLFKTFSPSIVLDILLTVTTSLPISLLGLKSIYGYFLVDGFISSKLIFSNNFFLEVACLDLEALALNLCINSFNSVIFSSFFLLDSFTCLSASWLDSYQKS